MFEHAAMAVAGRTLDELLASGLVTTAGRAEPENLGAEDAWVPVHPALAGLFPGGALRRGTVVNVIGSGSLLLATLAEASSAGAWCAEVGEVGLGMVAAAEAGIVLDRFVRVPEPGERWPEVVAALLDGFDLVVVHRWVHDGVRPSRVEQAVRRLTARARERRAVLLATWAWPGATLDLSIEGERWHGLGAGAGTLQTREVEVVATGRGSAVRPHRVRLLLPGPDGRPAHLADPGVAHRPERQQRAG